MPNEELDINGINQALGAHGLEPIGAAQAPAAAGAGGGQGGVPLYNLGPSTPAAAQDNSAAAINGGQKGGMDWGALAQGMGDMQSSNKLSEPGYNSDMNQMRMYSRQQDEQKRQGNGPQHAAAIMSIFGSFFGGGGGGGGMGGALGNINKNGAK